MFCLAGQKNSRSQNTPLLVISHSDYDRVLDILFPKDDPDTGKTIWLMVLRFKPNSSGESQIVIRRFIEGWNVTEYQSAEGSIYKRLNLLLGRAGKATPEDMAKLIKIRKRSTSFSLNEINQLLEGFFETLSLSKSILKEQSQEFDKTGGEETILLHGTIYEVKYSQGLNSLSLKLYDSELDEFNVTGKLPLVQWMNVLRLAVKSHR
jgi:hypothetical protein